MKLLKQKNKFIAVLISLLLFCVTFGMITMFNHNGKVNAAASDWTATTVSTSNPTWVARTADSYVTQYDATNGLTNISGLNAWGKGMQYGEKIVLDGATIMFGTNNMNDAVRFGFGLTSSNGGYTPDNTSDLDIYFSGTGYGQVRLAFAKNHNWTNDGTSDQMNIGYWYSDSGTKNTNIGVDNENTIVYSLDTATNKNYAVIMTFHKVNDSEWRIDFEQPSGGFVSPWESNNAWTRGVYIPASYLPVDSNGKIYVSAWGINSDIVTFYRVNAAVSSTGVSVTDAGDGFVSVNNLKNRGDRAYYKDRVYLDGLSVTMYCDNLNGSYVGDKFGFGFVTNGEHFSPDRKNAFNAVFRTYLNNAGGGLNGQARLSYNRDDSGNYTIAYADKTMRNMVGLVDGTRNPDYIFYWDFANTAYLGVKLSFKYLVEGDLWQVTTTPYGNCSMVATQSSISYFSPAYVASILDPNGKVGLVAYGQVGASRLTADPSASLNVCYKVEKTCTVTYNTADTSYTKNYAVGSSENFDKAPSAESSFTSADNTGKMFIGWSIDGTLYPASSEFLPSGSGNVTAQAKYLDFALFNGAEVRKSATLDNSGIRFHAGLKKDADYNSLASVIKGVGVIVLPTDMLDSTKDFTIANYGSDVANFYLDKNDFAFDDNGVMDFYASIVNLYATNYNRNFSARVYAKIGFNDGEEIIYGDYNSTNNSRTIYQVSASASADFEEGSIFNSYVDTILNVSYTDGQFSLVNPKASSSIFGASIASGSVSGGKVTLVINVNENFTGSFSGLIFNNRRIDIRTSQSYANNKVTITFNQPKGFVAPIFTNFWTTDTMIDETIMLVAQADRNGNVISAPKAKLMFDPTEIISVKWYYHTSRGNETIEFTEGTNFEIVDGYIVAKGSFKSNSYTQPNVGESTYYTYGDMPFVTVRQVEGIDTFPGMNPTTNSYNTTDVMYSINGPTGTLDPRKDANTANYFSANYKIPFCESVQFFQMQLYVTYRHNQDGWDGYTPKYYGDTELKTSVGKLTNTTDNTLDFFFIGDSITAGCFSSGTITGGINPYYPHWTDAICQNLSSYYNKNVVKKNIAIGGWTSTQGVQGDGAGTLANRFATGDLSSYVPDIAVIAFGMNDATWDIAPSTYESNIRSIVNTIRSKAPDCDIVLVSPMHANRQSGWFANDQAGLHANLQNIDSDYNGMCTVSISALENEILESGKKFIEMMGNNINHTSDLMNRVYAMSILSAFIPN